MPNKKGILLRKQSFGKVVEDYKKYRKPYDLKLYKKFYSLLFKHKKSFKILDIGCGTGRSTEPLVTALPKKFKGNFEIIGCDHDFKMIKSARLSAFEKQLPIKYVVGKAEKLPFAGDEFDTVIAGTAFHWFANKKALREVQRVLKKNGLFFIFWGERQGILDVKGKPIGADFYKQYSFGPIKKRWQDIEKIKKIFSAVGFKNFKSFQLSSTYKSTLEEIIGGHKSFSKYAMLTQKQRVDYINHLKEAYQKVFGRKKFLDITVKTTVCFAYK